MTRRVFGDTVYWVALADPNDQWHPQATRQARLLRPVIVTTTEDVIVEFLAAFAKRGAYWRREAASWAHQTLSDPGAIVHPQTHQSFLQGLALYERRLDKGYSLTDCISMNAMRSSGLMDVLTHDAHFRQEGFNTLL